MLLLTGLCHGYKQNVRQQGTNTFQDNFVLVEIQDTNQYGIAETKTIVIKLSKADVDTGLQHVYDQYKGKQVSVPVRVSPWASKAGNAGFDFWLSGDRKPIAIQLGKPLQAAS